MRLEEIRQGVFRGTFTAHELSVLVAGARMSLALMEAEGEGTDESRDALRRVLDDFDAALGRTRDVPEAGADAPASEPDEDA